MTHRGIFETQKDKGFYLDLRFRLKKTPKFVRCDIWFELFSGLKHL